MSRFKEMSLPQVSLFVCCRAVQARTVYSIMHRVPRVRLDHQPLDPTHLEQQRVVSSIECQKNLLAGKQSICDQEVTHEWVASLDPGLAMQAVHDLQLTIEYYAVVCHDQSWGKR